MPYLILWVCILLALLVFRLSLGAVGEDPLMEVGADAITGKREIYADAYDWARFGSELMYVVANGIGRNRKGELAAKTAVETVVRLFETIGATDNPSYFFNTAFHAANTAILQRIVDSSAGASMLCAVVKNGRLYYALVGNCRISVLRRGDLIPLSEGQTVDVLVKKAFRQGQITRMDALSALKEKRLYGFVGHDGFRGVELFDVPVTLKRGDVIVLMTDGVYEFCTAKQLEDVLHPRISSVNMARGVMNLLCAEDDSEQDNATILLAKVKKV